MKTRVGVFFGGQSVEHEISILTAMQVLHALDEEDYVLVPVYVAKDGAFYTSDRFRSLDTFKDLTKALEGLHPVTIMKKDQRFNLVKIVSKHWITVVDTIDIACNLMHGSYGEDGSFVGYCRMLSLPCTGSDLDGCVIGQDKVTMRQVMAENKIPIVNWTWCYDWMLESEIEEVLTKCIHLGFPLLVKPALLGSSIGITKVNNQDELLQALHLASQYGEKIVVESCIESLREFNCAYLGNVEYERVSAIEEVFSNHDILSYEDKYGKSGSKETSSHRVIVVDIPVELQEQIRYLTVKICRQLHLSGVVRVDFLYDNEKEELYVNEVNTIPGSLAFYLLEPEGVSFQEIMAVLIQDTLRKERLKATKITSYKTNVLQNFDSSKGIKGK
ncbi:MAG: D-alanine--D-alanine ligase [Erysipelotrichaceae bacterium]|nr:D-alanine--D-alanine ligase [Erysipelotrichaceae bacterium]